jgi:hypothetical protein
LFKEVPGWKTRAGARYLPFLWTDEPLNHRIEIRMKTGVNNNRVLHSAGLEETEDLIADICNPFDRLVVKTNNYSKRLENY